MPTPTADSGKPLQQPWPAPNPALKDLEALAGEWEMELSNAEFLPNKSDTVKGHVSLAWSENGAFLAMRQAANPPDASSAIWWIGRDESSASYQVLYYDSRGVSRIYSMSFQDRTWKIWRNSPGFSQRYEGRLTEDGDTIEARWEKSTDGKNWQHDFHLKYTRTR